MAHFGTKRPRRRWWDRNRGKYVIDRQIPIKDAETERQTRWKHWDKGMRYRYIICSKNMYLCIYLGNRPTQTVLMQKDDRLHHYSFIYIWNVNICNVLSELFFLDHLQQRVKYIFCNERVWRVKVIYIDGSTVCVPFSVWISKRPENSVKIQPYNSRPTLCPKSRI